MFHELNGSWYKLFIYFFFQAKKQELKKNQESDNALLSKSGGLSIELVTENEDDVKLAKLLMHNRPRGILNISFLRKLLFTKIIRVLSFFLQMKRIQKLLWED